MTYLLGFCNRVMGGGDCGYRGILGVPFPESTCVAGMGKDVSDCVVWRTRRSAGGFGVKRMRRAKGIEASLQI